MFLPFESTKKEHVLAIIYSAALYGCEASMANEQLLARLSSLASRVVFPVSSRRSQGISFSLTSPNKETDPSVVILLRRCIMLRRMIAKLPDLAITLAYTISLYAESGFPGTEEHYQAKTDDAEIPRLGHPDRALWKQGVCPMGPVGLLLYSISQYNIYILINLSVCVRLGRYRCLC